MSKRKNAKDNKVLWVLIGILAVCFLAIGFGFYKYFYAGASKNKYGERLSDIKKHPLPKDLESDVKSLYKSNSYVKEVTVDVKGRVIYINIDFGKSLKKATAQGYAIKALDKIGDDNLKYYDVQFVLTCSGDKENTNFPLFGAKSSSSLKVVW